MRSSKRYGLSKMLIISMVAPLFFLVDLSSKMDTETKFEINLKFAGLKEERSNLMVAIFNSESDFLGENRFKEIVLRTEGKSDFLESRLELPAGTYAIAVFQDLNLNGKLDKNWVGVPVEPYGFSNNPRIVFQAPTWTECLFSLSSDIPISIELN